MTAPQLLLLLLLLVAVLLLLQQLPAQVKSRHESVFFCGLDRLSTQVAAVLWAAQMTAVRLVLLRTSKVFQLVLQLHLHHKHNHSALWVLLTAQACTHDACHDTAGIGVEERSFWQLACTRALNAQLDLHPAKARCKPKLLIAALHALLDCDTAPCS